VMADFVDTRYPQRHPLKGWLLADVLG